MKLWLRPLPFALLGALLVSRATRATVDDAAPSRSAALCAALAHRGIVCAEGEGAVLWLDPPVGAIRVAMGTQTRALVRAKEPPADTQDPGATPSEALDLFLATARLSPEGRLLDLGDIHDLTHTSNADELTPITRGSLVAYAIAIDGQPEAVHVLDLAGHDRHAYEELSRGQRLQVAIADWQATGLPHGVKRTVYALVPPPKRAELSWRADGALVIASDARSIVLNPTSGEVLEGSAFVRTTPEVVAKPPTLAPWMSDRLRAISWFGDEKNQALKAIAFTAIEWLKGAKSKLTGDTGERDAQEDMGAVREGKAPAATFTDPEIGWPPKALEPFIKPPLTGEGQWVALEKDPFITPIPGVASPFVTTFVRTDPSALQTRVYVTLWDPRLVALHMEAGTVEPVSATGEAGPGQIPRTPEVMRHVVAGFNGGFQATHGEFGMQANGVLYLPPKPYGATVMELRDGTTGFGAWPKATDVPDDILSFRQNMTPLVQNDKYNPWGRAWWGGVPPGWHDAIHTTRSGLCLTKEGFVAYFYGNDIGPEPLGRAMLQARCAFGIHLDMNPGLAGFEFYNMQPTAKFQPLGRPLQSDWEYEGSLKDMPDFKFRSRRMIKSMGHMLFPRYIHRDGRDFFYLTTRTVLPGAAIGGESDGGAWRVKGLPQHGYPYAVAITSVRAAGDKRLRVVRVDPRTVRGDGASAGGTGARGAGAGAGNEDPKSDPVVVTFGRLARPSAPAEKRRGHDAGAPAAAAPTAKKLLLGRHVFSIDKPSPDATVIADVVENVRDGADARAAVGISDEDGMLEWVEIGPDDKPSAALAEEMSKLLASLGCSQRALVVGDVRAFLGGSVDAAAEPIAAPVQGVALRRKPAPAAKLFFDTDPVPQSVWYPLQQQRVKWRPTLAPPDKPAASASASASASPVAPK